jgi:hypothetical protein
MNMYLTLFGLVGLTIIISTGAIFEKTRDLISSKSKFFGELISCPMCLGFWVGLIFSFIYKQDPFVLSGLVSLFSWVFYNIVDLISTASAYITNCIMIQGVRFDTLNNVNNIIPNSEEIESENNE